MKLKFAFAALLAATSFSAMAADQALSFSTTDATVFTSLATSSDPLFSDGSDTLTFSGLTTGTYNVQLSFSTLNSKVTSATLNGVTGTLIPVSNKITFGSIDYTGTSPFVLVLGGNVTGAAAAYSGQLSVSAVPEPESYAMMLGGLGLIGFMAARRRKSNAA